MKLILHFAILVAVATAQGFDITIDAISILVKEATIEGVFPVKVERSISDVTTGTRGLKLVPTKRNKGKKTPPTASPTSQPSPAEVVPSLEPIPLQPVPRSTPEATTRAECFPSNDAQYVMVDTVRICHVTIGDRVLGRMGEKSGNVKINIHEIVVLVPMKCFRNVLVKHFIFEY
ncbi:hypothetical protein MHU86_18591 [Fragilaria crotonensis]|nr:hypothetical protein MHU86_18591 [Fragilaria crotonensis]